MTAAVDGPVSGQLGSRVALVHDYVTQRGGAERVVVTMLKAFPGAPLYTALYDPAGSFDGFPPADIRPSALNRVTLLRRHHRVALPLLAPAFETMRVRADVVLCSSSGWAHGVRATGRKVVYCHTPARWLYQADRYLGEHRAPLVRAGLAAMAPLLRRWDGRAARSADRYLVNSTAVRDRVRALYGIDAEVLPPPPAVAPGGAEEEVPGLSPGYWLCVSRLLPYKNVGPVLLAFAGLPDERLVVAGSGPMERALVEAAPPNVSFTGHVGDARLSWLYARACGLVAASHEDFGLTPLEANGFGKPVAALAWGGFLDTVVDGTTGRFFEEPTPHAIRSVIQEMSGASWSEQAISDHAARFSEQRFIARLRAVVDEAGAVPRGRAPARTESP